MGLRPGRAPSCCDGKRGLSEWNSDRKGRMSDWRHRKGRMKGWSSNRKRKLEI